MAAHLKEPQGSKRLCQVSAKRKPCIHESVQGGRNVISKEGLDAWRREGVTSGEGTQVPLSQTASQEGTQVPKGQTASQGRSPSTREKKSL